MAEKTFTLAELAEFDGKNGKPVYVAYQGKVYDVSESDQWQGGDHMGHTAGMDLTESMDVAPHADDVMGRFKVVGTLTT
jgi:predicted heme/steroid binding protein